MSTTESVAMAPESTEPSGDVAPEWSPRWFVLLPAFVVLSFLMTYRSLGRLDSHIVGNSGDPLFVLWTLGWVQHAVPHGWGDLWNTSMYAPSTNTLAYSDSMISAGLVHWPLRVLFGPVLAMNILAIAAHTALLWFSYRLVLVLTRSWPAALVAAFMFGFSTPYLAHLGHYQLMLTAFLVPLLLLLLVRYLEEYRLRYGIGMGLGFGALTTSATYYGLMMAVGLAVVLVGYLVWFRPRSLWPLFRGLLAGAAVAAVITLPVAVHYMDLQQDPYFKRGFDPGVAAHVEDFASPDGAVYLLDEVPPFETTAVDRGVENHLFPGLLTVGFAVVGVVVLVGVLRRREPPDPGVGDGTEPSPDRAMPVVDDRWRARITVLVALAGAASVLLAFGDEVHLFGHRVPLPFKVFRKVVPGFSGIRATSRFVLLGECALALVAAFGVRAALRRCSRRGSAVLVVVLCALVVAEAARAVPLVEVPDSRTDEAVGRFLADRPDGTVVELPIRGTMDGAAWAYTEAPRLYVSLVDANRRLNGYSGYVPPGFDEQVPVLDGFPSEESLAILDRDGVRYVVLRTRVIGDQLPPFDQLLREDGVGRYTPATARAIIARIPPERVKKVSRVPGAYIVELRPPS